MRKASGLLAVYVAESQSATKRQKRYQLLVAELEHRMRRVRTPVDLVTRFASARRDSVWLSSSASAFSALTEAMPSIRGERRLLVFQKLPETTRNVLDAYFRHILAVNDDVHLLPSDQLAHVLTDPNRRNLFIGCSFDEHELAMVLFRGTIEPLVIPLTWFTTRPGGVRPEPGKCRLIDFGQTLQLGDYEAAASAILYEFDPVFRRERRKQMIHSDSSLGASIRRLRLQKGISRADFSPIAEKTMARIERSEVEQPRDASLRIIASRLGVAVNALGGY